jgi:hypothetical protein
MPEELDSASAKQTSAKTDKSLTPEDFVVRWPLYTPFNFRNFVVPQRISLQCDGSCEKETTWARTEPPSYQYMKATSQGFKWVYFVCSLCQESYIVVLYRELEYDTVLRASGVGSPAQVSILTKVQKIGQYPPLSINIPKALEKSLGEDSANLYKKALINRNEGYGLAAVTYIRRVVEDKTDELIEVVATLAETHNVEAGVVQKIRAARKERTTYDNKLKIAATVLPESLVIDGVNPLGVLYDLVSLGIHDLSEEKCIDITDETRSVFEFTFTNLRAETKTRNDFVAKVRKWAGGKEFGDGRTEK